MIRLALQALRHHRGLFAGVVLASVLTTAMIGGGLLVGEALRAALTSRTAARLGPVDVVVEGPEGGVTAELATRLGTALGTPVAAALHRTAVARGPEGTARTVDLWGFDAGLAALAGRPDVVASPGEVRLRADLAARLGVVPGDRLTLRVEKPGALPRDVALAQAEGAVVGLSAQVGALLPEAWPARLGLDARPGDPDVVIVDRTWLAARIGGAGRATRLLVAGASEADVARVLPTVVALEDGALTLTEHGGEALLSTPRVLLPARVAEVATALPQAAPALVWLVDGFEVGSKAASYAFVGAVDPAAGLALGSAFTAPGPGGVVIVEPLAEELGVGPGAELLLRYPTVDRGRTIQPGSLRLTVEAVVPVLGGVADPSWMPPIEGVAGRASCRDWDPGLPLDLDRITDADEAWWAQHQGTPKAWIALSTATQAFGGPLGDRTAVRWPVGTDVPALRAALTEALGPEGLGVRVLPVRGRLEASEVPANDFGTLFLGFQAVLLVSALALAGLQAALTWEARAAEIGALRALGWSARRVLTLAALELGLAAGAGAILGLPAAFGVARLLLAGLEGPWQAAMPGMSLAAVTAPGPVLVGAVASAVTVTGAALLTVRRQLLRPVRALLAGTTDLAPVRSPRAPLALAALLLVAAAAVGALSPSARTPEGALGFFAAGGLAWVAGLALALAATRVSVGSPLGVGAAGRRPGRAVTVVALVSLGAFLVTGVGLGGGRPHPDVHARTSGTGGFGWLVQTALPVPERLDRPEGLAVYDLPVGGAIVPLAVLDGDDASCLQLGSAQAPTLLGVDPGALTGRFTFVDAPDVADPWSLLQEDLGPGRIPAVGDASTVTWGLHTARGGSVTWLDRDGAPVEVVIVAVIGPSILQGALLVDRGALQRVLPSVGGDRWFLVEGENPPPMVAALDDRGASAVPAAERLAAFAAVEEAYVGVFRALGALGLMLGAAGLALLLARAVEERRGELALLRALGFRPGRIARDLALEHGALVVGGLIVGTVAGLVAVAPMVLAPDAAPPWVEVGVAVIGTGVVGLVALFLAARRATARIPLHELARERR